MTASTPSHLEPSQLGTKEYWEGTYANDLTNYGADPSHTGQDWFSDNDASSKVLEYLTSSDLNLNVQNTSFLDVGTGNGEMLFLLQDEGGFEGNMIGVDYSDASVEFCRRRMTAMKEDDATTSIQDISFEMWDIMRTPPREEWKAGFDVVLDKGTFDAISLSEETDEIDRRVCDGYREKVEVLVKTGGLLIVTSCNWTEEELKKWFGGGALEIFGRIEYPVFSFGGQTGQSISTVCFKKKR